jgi:chromate reductase, NAD(P)H dehydrogenase (quinone)
MRAQLAIRPVLAVNEAYVMPKPELYIVNAPQRFDADGNLTDATVRETVRDIVVALAAWTRRLRAD